MTVQFATHKEMKLQVNDFDVVAGSRRMAGMIVGAQELNLTLRTIPNSFAPDTLAAIDTLLDTVSAQHGVTIPLAIESGSRAWGFPSPDSD